MEMSTNKLDVNFCSAFRAIRSQHSKREQVNLLTVDVWRIIILIMYSINYV